jgi:hypothetical protein
MTITRDNLDMGPVEAITSVARRRRWGPEEKRAMVSRNTSPITQKSVSGRSMR